MNIKINPILSNLYKHRSNYIKEYSEIKLPIIFQTLFHTHTTKPEFMKVSKRVLIQVSFLRTIVHFFRDRSSTSKSSLFGITNGSPNIKDKFIWECKVSKSFIECHSKFIWIVFVLPSFKHCGS